MLDSSLNCRFPFIEECHCHDKWSKVQSVLHESVQEWNFVKGVCCGSKITHTMMHRTLLLIQWMYPKMVHSHCCKKKCVLISNTPKNKSCGGQVCWQLPDQGESLLSASRSGPWWTCCVKICIALHYLNTLVWSHGSYWQSQKVSRFSNLFHYNTTLKVCTAQGHLYLLHTKSPQRCKAVPIQNMLEHVDHLNMFVLTCTVWTNPPQIFFCCISLEAVLNKSKQVYEPKY